MQLPAVGELANERLRAALLEQGETLDSLAAVARVDPKTVERWSGGRIPYKRTRYLISRHLKVDEAILWPTAAKQNELNALAESELIQIYANRSSVPRDIWARIFDAAEEDIGILVYSGTFLIEDAGIRNLLMEKADQGVRVRLLMGDPDSPELAERGAEEGIDDGMIVRARNALIVLKRMSTHDGVEIRLHGTTLYNSIYRGDDELLINPHVFGIPASDAPVLHLLRVLGGTMVKTYTESFERVWATARPLTPGT